MQYTVDRVIKAYSGRRGCACGCRGKYTYSSTYAATEMPSYYDADAVNDRSIRSMFTRIMKDPNVKFDDNIAYVDTDTRTKFLVFSA